MIRGLVPRYAALLGLLLAGFWLVTEFVALPWVVSGGSMEPALSHGDRVIVDLWTYRHRSPRPGEIVLLRGPLPNRPTLIKRAWDPPSTGAQRPQNGRWPAGQHAVGVWVLGDHASDSTDSRHFGSVPPEQIRGRVILRYWPLEK